MILNNNDNKISNDTNLIMMVFVHQKDVNIGDTLCTLYVNRDIENN